jgi:hypothetical protein
MRMAWPRVLQEMKDYDITEGQMLVVGSTLWNYATFLAINAVMVVVYTSEMPWLERYRVDRGKPWPWKVDREAWRGKLVESLK